MRFLSGLSDIRDVWRVKVSAAVYTRHEGLINGRSMHVRNANEVLNVYRDKGKKVDGMSNSRFKEKSFEMQDESSHSVREGSAKLPPFGEKDRAMKIIHRIFAKSKTGDKEEWRFEEIIWEKPPASYFLYDVFVAGVAYYDFSDPASLATLSIGEPVALKRQPDNPHDRLAIEIYTRDGRKIGYVPRQHNALPASLMDQGAHLAGRIVALDAIDGPWQAVKVMLELLVPGSR